MRFLLLILIFVIAFFSRYHIEDFYAKKNVAYHQNVSMSNLSHIESYGFLFVNEHSLQRTYQLFQVEPSNLSYIIEYAQQLIMMGNISEGIDLFEGYLIKPSFDLLSNSIKSDFIEILVGAYFKQSEVRHCLNANASNACILPLDSSVVHNNTYDIQQVLHYLSMFEIEHSSTLIWLKSLANHLIHREGPILFDYFNPTEHRYFSNQANALGVSDDSLAGSVIIDDFNNDDLLDIFVTAIDHNSTKMYFGQPDGGYLDVTTSVNLDGVIGGLNAVQVDVNNDGFLDIFITRGAWLGNLGKISNSLLMNKNGVFFDVTRSSGLNSKFPTQVASWADVNLDGCVDVFIGNELYYSELYINNCKGKFHNKASDYGLDIFKFVKGAAWGDVNNDGRPDLMVSVLGDSNILFLNQGEGQEMKRLKDSGVENYFNSFPTWFFDFNNDGLLDIYLGFFSNDPDLFVDRLLGNLNVDGGVVLLNQGDLSFEPLKDSGLNLESYNTMGANFGDVNGDGFLDYFVGTGAPSLSCLVPSEFYLNLNGRDIKNTTIDFGLGHLQKGHGISFADIDYDGDLDIYIVNGGWYPVDTFNNSLFINSISSKHWINLHLVGIESNRFAIGARVKLTAIDSDGVPHDIYRTIGSGGSFGSNPFEELIAFSDYQLQSIDIHWPSGINNQFTPLQDNIELNQSYEIHEDGFIQLIDRSKIIR